MNRNPQNSVANQETTITIPNANIQQPGQTTSNISRRVGRTSNMNNCSIL